MARMAKTRDMLRGLGLKPELVGSAETLRRLPILEGGDRPSGALMHDDAIVHHDAVMSAYRAACAPARHRRRRRRARSSKSSRAGAQIAGVRTGSRRDPRAAGRQCDRRLVGRLLRPRRRPDSRTARCAARRWSPSRRSRFMQAAITFYRPKEGWFNQTLRGETVAGCLAPAEPLELNLRGERRARSAAPRAPPRQGAARSAISAWSGNGPASMT